MSNILDQALAEDGRDDSDMAIGYFEHSLRQTAASELDLVWNNFKYSDYRGCGLKVLLYYIILFKVNFPKTCHCLGTE